MAEEKHSEEKKDVCSTCGTELIKRSVGFGSAPEKVCPKGCKKATHGWGHS